MATVIGLIDGKWKVFILRNLLQSPDRFSDLKRTIPGVSPEALSEALKSMRVDGLLVKEVSEGPTHRSRTGLATWANSWIGD